MSIGSPTRSSVEVGTRPSRCTSTFYFFQGLSQPASNPLLTRSFVSFVCSGQLEALDGWELRGSRDADRWSLRPILDTIPWLFAAESGLPGSS